MRLINADALKEFVKEKCFYCTSFIGEEKVLSWIDKAPTIDPNELDLDIDYSIEYDKRPDGISNAKVTITKIKPCKSTEQNVADVPIGDTIRRAEAIETVQTYLDILINSRRHGDDFTFINVLTDIRNKISTLPSADRPIIEHDKEWIIGCIKHDGFIKTDRFDKANNIIVDALESCDRPSGEWEFCKDEDGVYGICSVCGNDADFSHYGKPYAYCPSCGAIMVGDPE